MIAAKVTADKLTMRKENQLGEFLKSQQSKSFGQDKTGFSRCQY